MPHKNRWKVESLSSPITPEDNIALSEFAPIFRQLLVNRKIHSSAEAHYYLDAETISDTSPFQLKDMDEAIKRIIFAIDHQELIAIYGDYDVDGVTATALLVQTLRALNANVIRRFPNRFEEGYGLNTNALKLLQADGVQLVITVDNGIRSIDEVKEAKEAHLDIIITDHHQPAMDDLPDALAVVDPKRMGDQYPYKELAGVGVAYKIAQALISQLGERIPDFHLDDLLDLVALGTVADLAPLVGENRALVRKGLQRIRETTRKGLFSLAAVSDLALPRVTVTSIGFILGPRLNAAGRLTSAEQAYELLTTLDAIRAVELAQKLNIQNRERQEITRKIQEDAEKIILTTGSDSPLLFAVHPDFNQGVVGLAAARLVETYYRPAIVGQSLEAEGIIRCSCRSIPEFHITEALDQCKDLLIRHGGHAAAAGFTVSNENLEALKSRLMSIAYEKLGTQDLRQTLRADVEVRLSDLRFELFKQLEALQPTGNENPEAVFVSRDVRVKDKRAVGIDGKHLKLTVTDGYITFDAIGFRLGHLREELPPKVDILYTFESNEYNGRTSLQLNLKDIKPAGVRDQ